MKNLFKLFAICSFVFVAFACGNNKSNSEKSESAQLELGNAKVEVLYFHSNRRCASCNKIEEIAKNVVSEDFKNDDVKFHAINFDNKENKELAEKFKINWSSLVIVSSDENTDLTDRAFQLINADSEKLRSEVVETISLYLNK